MDVLGALLRVVLGAAIILERVVLVVRLRLRRVLRVGHHRPAQAEVQITMDTVLVDRTVVVAGGEVRREVATRGIVMDQGLDVKKYSETSALQSPHAQSSRLMAATHVATKYTSHRKSMNLYENLKKKFGYEIEPLRFPMCSYTRYALLRSCSYPLIYHT